MNKEDAKGWAKIINSSEGRAHSAAVMAMAGQLLKNDTPAHALVSTIIMALVKDVGPSEESNATHQAYQRAVGKMTGEERLETTKLLLDACIIFQKTIAASHN